MSFLKYQSQNPEFLNNYLKYTRYISFSAETTVNEVYFDLRTFFRYIKLVNSNELENTDKDKFKTISIKDVTIDDIRNVTRDTIEHFLLFLRYTLNNCPKTRNKKLASIKRFFEYLDTNNIVSYNPVEGFRTAKIEKRNAKFLNLNESKNMLSKTINSDSKFKTRNYAITCLFLNCGIRLSELVGINISDIKLDEMTLRIRGKGNKERIIYLNTATKEVITEYLKVRPKITVKNQDYDALFLSERKQRISKRTVQDIITKELKVIFNEKCKDYHTHSLRYTSATLMYNINHTDIFIIKKILGHESLEATEVYTQVFDEELRRIMNECTISSILERKVNLENEQSNKLS